jgi:taurine dioxygenase
MPASSEMKVTRLSGSIGAAITGVDLKSVDSAGIAAIRAAFLEHCMVVFPNQFLGADDQHAFAKKLGEIMIYDGIEQDPNLPDGMMKFTNDGKDKVITENWHFDGMYYPEPPAVGILAAQRLPSAGGDTMWSNQYLAYERLSDGLKQILNGLHCHYETHRVVRKYELGKMPSAIQPAVRRHPETGRLALYVGNPDSCLNFIGWTRQESEPLIRWLYNHAFRPDAVYRHVWKAGDVVMWDNRCTMHYAVHDYGSEPRDMHRATIKGERALGPLES